MKPPRSSHLHPLLFYCAAVPLLAAAFAVSIGLGSTELGWYAALRAIGLRVLPAGWVDSTGISRADQIIVWFIRVPRALVAVFAGAGLSVAGAQMQALFRNPLAEPGLLGVGAGAVLGGVTVIVSGLAARAALWLPLAAFAGALLALFTVYTLATRNGATPVATLLLAGVAVSSLLGAVSSLFLSLNLVSWQVSQEILYWTMGGLDSRTWIHVWISAPFVVFGCLVAFALSRELDLILHGEETALVLGVEVESVKRITVASAALLTGAAVAVAGLIGFVGLLIPHAVRLLLGPSNRVLLPASAVAGAAFLLWCDLAARTIHPPGEIRLGILTALCGAPFFLFLMLRRQREGGRS